MMDELIYKNPVDHAIRDLGGAPSFCRLLALQGIIVERQTVYGWRSRGVIPSKYKRVIEKIAKTYPIISDPKGLLKSVAKFRDYTPAVFSNQELADYITKRFGGIGGLVKFINDKIRRYNIGQHESNRQKLFTYAVIHNWLLRGAVPISRRDMFVRTLEFPEHILGITEQDELDALKEAGIHVDVEEKPLTPEDLLGE